MRSPTAEETAEERPWALGGQVRATRCSSAPTVYCFVAPYVSFTSPLTLALVLTRAGGHRRQSRLLLEVEGRSVESAVLNQRVASLNSSMEPSLTFVFGAPGVGKSHLLRELRRCYYGSQGLAIAHVEAQRYDAEPLFAWAQLLRTLIADHAQCPTEQANLT